MPSQVGADAFATAVAPTIRQTQAASAKSLRETFLGVYSGRGVALSSALGSVVGKWLVGRLGNEDLPMRVTELRLIPMHGIAVQVARFVHPYHRLQDRLS